MNLNSNLLLILCLVVAAVWYTGVWDEKKTFITESEAILSRFSGGEEAIAEVYDKASFPFQESALLASFVDKTDRITQTLGTFEAIVSVESSEWIQSIRGRISRIGYTLRFSHGVTTGVFSYLRSEGQDWRLLGFDINVPEDLVDKVKRVGAQSKRITAPAVIEKHIHKILADINSGLGESVWDAASPPFRASTSKAEFLALLSSIHDELGSFQVRQAILSSAQNADKTHAQIHALLKYEKATTTGTFAFVKVGPRWRLLRFKIAIPEPLLPNRKQ